MQNYKNKLQEYCQKNNMALPVYFSICEGESHLPRWKSKINIDNNFSLMGDPFWTKKEAEQNAAEMAYKVLIAEKLEEANKLTNNRLEEANKLVNNKLEETNKLTNNRLKEANKLISTPTREINIQRCDVVENTGMIANHSLSKIIDISVNIDGKVDNTPDHSNNKLPSNSEILDFNNLDILWEKKQVEKTVVLIDLENMQPNITKMVNSNKKIYFFMSVFSTVDASKYSPYGEIINIDSGINDAADHLMSYYAGKLTNTLDKNVPIIVGSRDRSSAILVLMLKNDGYSVEHYTKVSNLENAL
jgi:hypothetical protein